MMWNLQSCPATLLNERMWHFSEGQDMLCEWPLVHIFSTLRIYAPANQCCDLETMVSRLECTRVHFVQVSISVSRPKNTAAKRLVYMYQISISYLQMLYAFFGFRMPSSCFRSFSVSAACTNTHTRAHTHTQTNIRRRYIHDVSKKNNLLLLLGRFRLFTLSNIFQR